MKGFDVSYVQNGLSTADFSKAKAAGWSFVIIRLGTVLRGSLYTDAEFESKYTNAREAGLKVGIYFYSMAKSVLNAQAEATYVVKQLKGRTLDYPVFFDFEDPSQRNLDKDLSKKICEAFCSIVEKAGYQAGVYASYDWLTNRISPISSKYTIWLAQYPKATYKGRYEMHQYSSTTAVPGIGSRIDVNTTDLAPAAFPKKTTEKPASKPKEEPKLAAKISFPTLPKRGYFNKNDKGDEVKKLQTLLNKRGFNCGKVDGIYGAITMNAVKNFQKKNKLTSDGLFGKQSLTKLKALYK